MLWGYNPGDAMPNSSLCFRVLGLRYVTKIALLHKYSHTTRRMRYFM